jgi:hypothetical protein
MIHAKRRIDDARQILGNDYRYTSMKETSSQLVQRWTWNCGCILKCSGNGRDGADFAFHWDRCGGHSQPE